MIAAYCRVSTKEQADNQTILTQKQEIERKYTIDEWFLDEGVSGTVPFEERPAGGRLLNNARKFDTVVLYKLDRLARKPKIFYDAFEMLQVRQGLKVVFASEGCNDETSDSELMMGILASFASHERRRIAERCLDGKKRAARAGRILPGKGGKFGYDYADGKFTTNEDQKQVLTYIMHFVADDRMGARSVCERLREMGYLSPSGNKEWAKTTITNLIGADIYSTGIWQWSHKDEVYKVEVPVLVERSLQVRAQKQLKANRALCKRSSKNGYLLTTLIHGDCGRKYSSVPYHGKPFYRCSGRSLCDCKAFSATKIDQDVWNLIKMMLESEAFYKQYNEGKKLPEEFSFRFMDYHDFLAHGETFIRRKDTNYKFKAKNESELEVKVRGKKALDVVFRDREVKLGQDERKKELKKVEQQLERLCLKENKLVDLFTESFIDKETFKSKKQDIENQRITYEEHKKIIEESLAQVDSGKLLAEALKRLKAKAENLDNLPFDKRRYLVHQIVSWVRVSNKGIASGDPIQAIFLKIDLDSIFKTGQSEQEYLANKSS